MELQGTGVDVTCVHPGVINTPIAQGTSYNGEAGREHERRLGEYYQAREVIRPLSRRGSQKRYSRAAPISMWA